MTSQKQILVVEDNLFNREMLLDILAGEYTVLEAENGKQALDILRQHKDDVALILLDVMMPVMDGFTFLDHLKADRELALIPVIVTTQSDSEADEVAALAHGATDFVPKPYRPQVILHRVASIINLRETAAMVNQFKYDRLTGLYSKEYFFQKARERLESDTEQEYTLVCANVENFKLYNDAFGTAGGDRLLKEIAEMMRQQIGEAGLCGRFGADRFVYLQKREQERADRANLEKQDQSGRIPHLNNMNMKWGVYEVTDRMVPVEQMCDRAFLAADSIKGQYNKRISIYDETLRSKLLREQAITDAMEEALTQKQFAVYLQPKYSLTNDRMAGAEALVRWIHPEWGFLSPGEFIPLFEKNGFISRLDQYVWEAVCALQREWKDKGYAVLPVSVNVSRADIYQVDLPNTLLGLVQKYGIEPQDLHLEVTESAYTENPDQIINMVEQLRDLGFVIEMDDFGSGYSSLNMLNQIKLDILKLDMKFIQSETDKPNEKGILRFIVELARWMNLRVVAEGVETREQLEHLQEIGCDYVQGYFFAKPMPSREYEELLKMQPTEPVVPSRPVPYHEEMQMLLVVDEDAAYREMVCQTFEGQFQVKTFSDAQQAIAWIAAPDEDISAVLLSTTLPDEGAAAFLKALRRNPATWWIPVLAIAPPCGRGEELVMDLNTDDFLCRRHPQRDLRKRVLRLKGLTMYQKRERMLQDEACRDYLTGLLNRRGLHTALEALRQEDLPAAMYLFDLDDLKRINDRFGHAAGDDLLCTFAELLRQHTRDGDILCRYGGDEFIVILQRISAKKSILKKGDEICRSFSEHQLGDGLHAACSAGVVLCGISERPSEKLIDRADQALYRAKGENKGGCCLWENQD